jgi:hypothetical protein
MQTPALHEDDWEYVRTLLPADLEESARRNSALVRCRNIPDAASFLRMALAYAVSDLSLKDVAAWASALQVAQIVGGSEQGGQNGSAGRGHGAIGRWQRVRPRSAGSGAGSLTSCGKAGCSGTQAGGAAGKSNWFREKEHGRYPGLDGEPRPRAAEPHLEDEAHPANGAHSSSLLSAIVSLNCAPS